MTAKAQLKSDASSPSTPPRKRCTRWGGISKTTLREFDEACRLSVPEVFHPQDIKKLRESNHVSQPIFARYLNTTESTVQKWEAGAKRPSGTALKLLSVVQKHGLNVPA